MKKVSFCSLLFLILALSTQAQFLPRDIAGLELWVSADTGIVLNGLAVSQWKDRSGNGNNVYQTTTSSQPLFIDSVCALNSFPVVRFDGIDDFMLMDSALTIGEAFVVANWGGTGNSFPGYNGLLTAQTASFLFIANAATTLLYSAGYFGNNISINNIQTSDFSPLGNYKIISGNSSTTFLFSNLIIGNDRGIGFRSWNGDVVEIIIYDTILSNPQRQQVVTYFQNKYFIASCSSSIENISEENALSIYPNPLTSSSILQLNTQLKNAEVVIYDIVGKEMLRKKLTGNRMEIEKGSLESGVYFVRVSAEEKQWVQKMVVQ